MADLLSFPTLPLLLQSRPRPLFDTVIQDGASGVEARVGRRGERFRFPIEIMLRPWLGEDETFFGFFRTVGGRRDSFLYVAADGLTYRVRFDADDLDWLDYENGVYSGEFDLVTVIA